MDSILVVGGGSWGTAFADYLARLGKKVKLWVWEKEVIQSILSQRENTVFLPGIKLAAELEPVADLEGEAGKADILILAVPSKFMRAVMQRMENGCPGKQTLVNLSKGFESDSLKTMSEVAAEVFGPDIAPRWITLSGPSFARELACQHPTAVVAAAANEELLKKIQSSFSSAVLRIYRTDDLKGLEVAGSVKNVMAIAAGMFNGLGYGFNTTAALVTRANMEISRLGHSLGAKDGNVLGIGRHRRPDADLFWQFVAQFPVGPENRPGRVAGFSRRIHPDGGRRGGDDQGGQEPGRGYGHRDADFPGCL